MGWQWPYGRRVLRPRVYPVQAGTWRAAPGGLVKLRTPPVTPIEAFTRRVSAPIGVDGQAAAAVLASGSVTLQAGPQGIGASWALDQAGISTSLGAADSATCAVYAGPQASAPYLVSQSYAGGGDAVGLAGVTLQPGEFVFAVWSGGTPGTTAALKVSGVKTVLAA